MSLLLEARKKMLLAQSSINKGDVTPEFDLERLADLTSLEQVAQSKVNSRNAGQNLFNAKSHSLPTARAGSVKRNLLLTLVITILLLTLGAGYMWHYNSGNDIQSAQTHQTSAAAIPDHSATAPPMMADVVSTEITATEPVKSAKESVQNTPSAHPASADKKRVTPMPVKSNNLKSSPLQTELPNPLLQNAYLAYRSGKLDEARNLYLDMLGKNARNIDALLGLAAIAQQRGEDVSAAQHFGRVLAMEPRNAVANAGMSGLSNDENNESRLKTLLNQQGDSAALHFALGNLYARQSRWSEAQQAYFNAYALNTNNADLAFNLAVSLDRLGQGKLAAQHYQRALLLDQSHSAGFDHVQIEQRVQELAR